MAYCFMIAHTYPQLIAACNDLTSWPPGRLAAVLTDCYIHTGLYTLRAWAGRAERWSVTLAMGS